LYATKPDMEDLSVQ